MTYASIDALNFPQTHFFLLVKLSSGNYLSAAKIQLPNKAKKPKHWKTITLCYARATETLLSNSIAESFHCRNFYYSSGFLNSLICLIRVDPREANKASAPVFFLASCSTETAVLAQMTSKYSVSNGSIHV